MPIFDQTVLVLQEMSECPDPVSLEAFRLQQLSADETAGLEVHLHDCESCQTALQQLTATADQAELQLKFEVFSRPVQQAIDVPDFFEPGQIWLSKAELDLSEFYLDKPGNKLQSSFMRHFLIVETRQCSLGNPAYQRLNVMPISEHILMATEHDLILSHSPFGLPIMCEIWNESTLLALHLSQFLGSIEPAQFRQVLKMRELFVQAQPLIGSNLPRGGQILNPEGPHARFQQFERQQVSYLQAPLQALLQLEAFSQNCFLHIAKQTLKKTSSGVRHPLVPPSIKSFEAEPVLAASNDLTESQLVEKGPLKERLELNSELVLDIWVEGNNLELYCHTLLGEDVAGLEVSLFNQQHQPECYLTDGYGGVFIPLSHFPAEEKQLLYFHLSWQSQELRLVYPFELIERVQPEHE